MHETFMLITGTIFIVLTIMTAGLFAVALMVTRQTKQERKLYVEGVRLVAITYDHYMTAIERSNELEVEKFRHELDCHLTQI